MLSFAAHVNPMSSPGGCHQTAVLLCAVAAITRDALWVSLGFPSDASRIRAEEVLQLSATLQATAAVEGWVRQWVRDVRDNPCLRGLGGRCGWGASKGQASQPPRIQGPGDAFRVGDDWMSGRYRRVEQPGPRLWFHQRLRVTR